MLSSRTLRQCTRRTRAHPCLARVPNERSEAAVFRGTPTPSSEIFRHEGASRVRYGGDSDIRRRGGRSNRSNLRDIRNQENDGCPYPETDAFGSFHDQSVHIGVARIFCDPCVPFGFFTLVKNPPQTLFERCPISLRVDGSCRSGHWWCSLLTEDAVLLMRVVGSSLEHVHRGFSCSVVKGRTRNYVQVHINRNCTVFFGRSQVFRIRK
jgi:hypothetical protein